MSDADNGGNRIKAVQARSGKWHVSGPRGCLSVTNDRVKSEAIRTVKSDKRRREWCSYCERELRILELRQEAERLQALLESIPVYVARSTGCNAADRRNVHLDSSCQHLNNARDNDEATLADVDADQICSRCLSDEPLGGSNETPLSTALRHAEASQVSGGQASE